MLILANKLKNPHLENQLIKSYIVNILYKIIFILIDEFTFTYIGISVLATMAQILYSTNCLCFAVLINKNWLYNNTVPTNLCKWLTAHQ